LYKIKEEREREEEKKDRNAFWLINQGVVLCVLFKEKENKQIVHAFFAFVYVK
jgi:hypothetical protein